MGEVYRVHDTLGVTVALKCVIGGTAEIARR